MFSLLVVLACAPPLPVWHQVADGYGDGETLYLQGRVLEDPPPNPKESGLVQNLRTLDTDEVADAVVEVKIGKYTRRVQADVEGIWTLSAPHDLPVGTTPATIRLISPKRIDTTRLVPVRIIPRDAPCVITDFDDTVVETGVRDTSEFLKNALFRKSAELQPVPGAPAAYAGVKCIFYVSGSPLAYQDRITTFLRKHKMPRGPIFLKTDMLAGHASYKSERIEALFARLPTNRFLLVGDSGERDPEIYRALREKFPKRVTGIMIRKVAGDESPASRFTGMTVVADYKSSAPLTERLIPR